MARVKQDKLNAEGYRRYWQDPEANPKAICPYQEGTLQHRFFMEGFESAKEEDKGDE